MYICYSYILVVFLAMFCLNSWCFAMYKSTNTQNINRVYQHQTKEQPKECNHECVQCTAVNICSTILHTWPCHAVRGMQWTVSRDKVASGGNVWLSDTAISSAAVVHILYVFCCDLVCSCYTSNCVIHTCILFMLIHW